jgi:hypothetical protein
VFVYIDESRREAQPPLYTIGALYTDKPITDDVIDSALSCLDADYEDDFKRRNRLFVDRIFHAREDPSPVRFAFCEAIAASGISGMFRVYTSALPQIYPDVFLGLHLNNDNKHYDLGNDRLITDMVQTWRAPLCLCFEARQGMSAQAIVAQIFDHYEHIERSFSQNWFIPTCYPNIEVEVCDKRKPGLQVVDYLLWALFHAGKHDYNSMLGLRQCDKTTITRNDSLNALDNATLVLGKGGVLRRGFLAAYPLPYDIDKIVQGSKNGNIESVRLVICRLADAWLPDHGEHLSELLQLAAAVCQGDGPHDDAQAELLFVTFLQLFDTLPIYDVKDPEQMTETLALKLFVIERLHAIRSRNGRMTTKVYARPK